MTQIRGKLALLALVLVFGAGTVRADSSPVVTGSVSLIELCPQSICGVALFVGVFQGRVGANPRAVGTVALAANHTDLPQPGDPCATITRGLWQIRTLARTINGTTVGQLCAVTDLTFDVDTAMFVNGDPSNSLFFSGLLDHTPFPPTLNGALTQTPQP